MRLPPQAIDEYEAACEDRVYLFTGGKSTGGFCVTRKGLLAVSQLAHILRELPALRDYTAKAGEWLPYKGKHYCWVPISPAGEIVLDEDARSFLHLRPGMRLLAIRSSDIAFTMGAEGPLLDRAASFIGELPEY